MVAQARGAGEGALKGEAPAGVVCIHIQDVEVVEIEAAVDDGVGVETEVFVYFVVRDDACYAVRLGFKETLCVRWTLRTYLLLAHLCRCREPS